MRRPITVVSSGGVTRADTLVRRRLPGLSRRQVQELFTEGRVRLNGQIARKGSNVSEGDTLYVELLDAEAGLRPLPDPALAIEVLFEDADLVALNKPAGIPTLPLHVGERGTLANFLAARYPDSCAVGGRFEAGLVHRLDTGTSGVILAARTAGAYRALRRQFNKREVAKAYVALVQGDVNASTTVNTPIAHARKNARRMETYSASEAAAGSRGRPASTTLRPVKRFGDTTLVAIRILTGVRHQIRIHLASVRRPIVGDTLYARTDDASSGHDTFRVHRPLLHARRLRFAHPTDGRLVRIVAPLPTDLQALLKRLKGSLPDGPEA